MFTDNYSVHPLVMGYVSGGVLKNELQAGEAFKYELEDKNYYVVKLWERLRETYYLSRNQPKNGEITYTIFAKKMEEDGKTWFRMPVGRAWFPNGLKTHLQLNFRLSRTTLYLSLFPADKTTEDLAA